MQIPSLPDAVKAHRLKFFDASLSYTQACLEQGRLPSSVIYPLSSIFRYTSSVSFVPSSVFRPLSSASCLFSLELAILHVKVIIKG